MSDLGESSGIWYLAFFFPGMQGVEYISLCFLNVRASLVLGFLDGYSICWAIQKWMHSIVVCEPEHCLVPLVCPLSGGLIPL